MNFIARTLLYRKFFFILMSGMNKFIYFIYLTKFKKGLSVHL